MHPTHTRYALVTPSLFFAALLLITGLLACQNDDDDGGGPSTPISPYEGCCGFAALEAEVGGASLYMPNIFTPNDDGINDLFFPLADDQIDVIDAFIVRTSAGTVLFNNSTFPPNDPTRGWDGEDAGGSLVEGLVEFELTATNTDGETATFTGLTCVYPCEPDEFPLGNLPDCQFGNQNNGMGEFDPFLPPFEDDCFQ